MIPKIDLSEKYTPEELREALVGKGRWVETGETPKKALFECPNCGETMTIMIVSNYLIACCPSCEKTFFYKPAE